VHGDYRIDNVILDRDDPAVVCAVVDWEMATLGDPLADLLDHVGDAVAPLAAAGLRALTERL
jgi:aminoglycoside phosphotransferase (APT) family kinase protein